MICCGPQISAQVNKRDFGQVLSTTTIIKTLYISYIFRKNGVLPSGPLKRPVASLPRYIETILVAHWSFSLFCHLSVACVIFASLLRHMWFCTILEIKLKSCIRLYVHKLVNLRVFGGDCGYCAQYVTLDHYANYGILSCYPFFCFFLKSKIVLYYKSNNWTGLSMWWVTVSQ